MKKFTLLGGAALFALSGMAMAQSSTAAPAPAESAPAPAEAAPAPTPAAPTAPTIAQGTAPAADAAATTPATPPAATAGAEPAPAAAAPMTPASATAEAAPAAPAPAAPSAGPVTATADAVAKVNADWAKYDKDGKGKLTPLEFGSWVLAAKGQDMTAEVEKTKTSKKADLPAIKVLNATAGDFTKADTDKDRLISPNELAVFLSA